MQFFQKSVQELITQTSTNLPPDVRQAMAAAITQRTAEHEVFASPGGHCHQYRHGER